MSKIVAFLKRHAKALTGLAVALVPAIIATSQFKGLGPNVQHLIVAVLVALGGLRSLPGRIGLLSCLFAWGGLVAFYLRSRDAEQIVVVHAGHIIVD